eukprot:g30637.t1
MWSEEHQIPQSALDFDTWVDKKWIPLGEASAQDGLANASGNAGRSTRFFAYPTDPAFAESELGLSTEDHPAEPREWPPPEPTVSLAAVPEELGAEVKATKVRKVRKKSKMNLSLGADRKKQPTVWMGRPNGERTLKSTQEFVSDTQHKCSGAASLPVKMIPSSSNRIGNGLVGAAVCGQKTKAVSGENYEKKTSANGLMRVRKAVFENRCERPVYLYGYQNQLGNGTIEFTEERGFLPWREQRITLSYGEFFGGELRPTNLDAAVIELNADYESWVVPKSHMSFLGQLGFSSLNLELALWKDRYLA